jgi:hypothetical protein
LTPWLTHSSHSEPFSVSKRRGAVERRELERLVRRELALEQVARRPELADPR